MGVPAEPREKTDTSEDVPESEERQSVDGDGENSVADGDEVPVGPVTFNKGVLDENDNLDFKVERLQLNALEADEDMQVSVCV